MGRKIAPKSAERPATLPSDQAAKLLRVQYEKGKMIEANRPISSPSVNAWTTATLEALENAFGSAAPCVQIFTDVDSYHYGGGNEQTWEADRAKNLGQRLQIAEGLIELLETKAQLTAGTQATGERECGSKVFLVHGHNVEVLQLAARFLETLELEVIVLREQPNHGRTIIEKFIDYSDVGFAVVLLTADDRGGVASAPFEQQRLRARQNVILELGYFIGKIGRKRVCALHQPGIEIPSDYSGVVFVSLDEGGGWRLELAREMKSVGLPIDMNKAL